MFASWHKNSVNSLGGFCGNRENEYANGAGMCRKFHGRINCHCMVFCLCVQMEVFSYVYWTSRRRVLAQRGLLRYFQFSCNIIWCVQPLEFFFSRIFFSKNIFQIFSPCATCANASAASARRSAAEGRGRLREKEAVLLLMTEVISRKSYLEKIKSDFFFGRLPVKQVLLLGVFWGSSFQVGGPFGSGGCAAGSHGLLCFLLAWRLLLPI